MTDNWAEPRSWQMKFLPPVGDDVTEDDESGFVGHFEKVEKATRATVSAIFRK